MNYSEEDEDEGHGEVASYSFSPASPIINLGGDGYMSVPGDSILIIIR